MDGARLNFSHGTHEQHAEYARMVRAAQDEVGRPIALIADLQGPKLRIGDLEEPMQLADGDEVVVTGGDDASLDGELPVLPAVIGQVLQPGHDVLIDDGLVRLRVENVTSGRARCAVVVGGTVSSHKGVNVPGVPVPIPALTRKDTDDLEFALGLGADFVALSFVRSAADVRDLKGLIKQAGVDAHVIAKIEKAEAIDALPAILEEADAIMVARGDLGVEIGVEVVPLLQKRIILDSLDRGKTVITATQMLESMVNHAEPTRAEASDVANAVLDGTSALMLSEETAIGRYPLEAVRTMERIARTIEPSIEYRHQFPQPGDEPTVGQAMSNAACDLAETLGAKAILVPTFTGRTASVVARLRPRRPIIGLSHHQSRPPAHGARVGRDADADAPGGRRGGALDSFARVRSRVRSARRGRPGGAHRWDRGEPPRHHGHDQALVRLSPGKQEPRSPSRTDGHAVPVPAQAAPPPAAAHAVARSRNDPRGRAPLLQAAQELSGHEGVARGASGPGADRCAPSATSSRGRWPSPTRRRRWPGVPVASVSSSPASGSSSSRGSTSGGHDRTPTQVPRPATNPTPQATADTAPGCVLSRPDASSIEAPCVLPRLGHRPPATGERHRTRH